MSTSPLDGSSGVVSIEIRADGTALDDAIEVLAIRVHREIGRIPKAVITFADGDLPRQEFPLTDADTLKPGAEVEILAGYDGTVAAIFKGIVTGQRLRLGGTAGVGQLEITCRDKAIAMHLARKSFLFQSKKDSDIISALVSDAGLTATVDSSSDDPRNQIQNGCTDWDFLRRLADRSGFVVIVEDGAVSAKKPDVTAAAELEVSLGYDVIRFDVEIGALDQIASAAAAGWDAGALAAQTVSGAAPTAIGQGNITGSDLASAVAKPEQVSLTSAALGTAELQAQADARRLRAELARIRGSVRMQGTALLSPGGTLKLSALSARFDGTGYVSGVLHTISDGEWVSDAVLGLDPAWAADSHAPAAGGAGGATAPVSGLQIGTVKAVADDPDALLRIEVQLPMLGDETTLWCRYGAPYASAGAGWMMVPEVGDEVVVGFLDDHPDHGIILASLHGTNARPAEVAAENTLKTFVSREGLELNFDEERKVVTLKTPGGNEAVLSDEAQGITLTDQNGNSVTLDASGITLDSASDVTITAVGNVTISATGDASLSGMNVSAEADIGFSASGNASAELTASGTVKVQGAMVQIN